MSKAYRPVNSKYIDSSGVIFRSAGGRNTKVILDEFLPQGSTTSEMYSTHYLQIGYLDCSMVQYDGWSTITMLISNTFYGVQHSCNYLVTIAQSEAVNINAHWLQGNTRTLFYKIDTTNKRIYLYASCWGGNAFGHWIVTVLSKWQCKWTTQIVHNIEYDSSWVDVPTDSGSNVNNKRNKHYIHVAKNNSTSEPITWTNTNVWNYITMTETIANTNTSMFSSASGVITIGDGVSKIRAYGQSIVQIPSWSANRYLFCRISKNDVGVSKAIFSELGWLTLTCEAYIPVTKGDKIKFEVFADEATEKKFYNYTGFGDGYGNFFIVEAIE